MAEEEKETQFVHLAVTFSEEDPDDPNGDGSISASMDLDPDKNGDKTQFEPGDTAHVRLFTLPFDVEMERWSSTAGVAVGPGPQTALDIVDEEVTFTDTDEASTSKNIYGTSVSVRWMGTPAGGAVTVSPSGKLKLSKKGVGIAFVSYTTKFWPGTIRVSEITEDPFKAMVYTRIWRKGEE